MYEYLADTDILMYDLLGYFSFVALLVFNLTLIKIKRVNLGNLSTFINNRVLKLKSSGSLWIFAIIEIFFISIFQGALTGLINNAFGDWVGTGGNYFGTLFLGPIILFLWFYIIGVDPFKEMDLITPAYAFRLIFAKLACFCAGCCRGFECSWGLYYPAHGTVMFPAQLLEALVSLIIFVIIMVYRKKAKKGTLFPIYMIIYCATRFLTEFTRIEEEVFWIFKLYHILCLIGVVVGVIWLLIVRKYSSEITEFYEYAPFPWVPKKATKFHGYKKENDDVVRSKNGTQKIQKDDKNHSQRKNWTLVWLIGLVGQIGWNVEGLWFNTFVYEKFDKNPSVITPMLILSALAITISIFLLGTMSERKGRRRTFISIGFVVWGALTILFGFNQNMISKSYITAVIGVVFINMLVSFFGSMSTDTGLATVAYDMHRDKSGSKVAVAIAVQCVLGTVLGSVIGGYIVGEENNYLRLFIVIGSVFVTLGIFCAYMFTKKYDIKPNVQGTFKEQLFSNLDFKCIFKEKNLLWANLSVIIFFIGFNVYFPYLGNYLIHYLGFSADKMGLVQAIPLLLVLIVVLFISKYMNKDKFMPFSIIAIISGIIGGVLIFPIKPGALDTTKIFDIRLFFSLFFLGVSYVVMLLSTKVLTRSLYPENSKGKYEGLWAISYLLIPMIIASVISQIIIKTNGYTVMNYLTNKFEYIPDGKIFLVGVIISSLSIVPVVITHMHSNKTENNKR